MVRLALIAAAGSSTRMGGPVKKEYLPLTGSIPGRTVLSACLDIFSKTQLFSLIAIVVPPTGIELARSVLGTDPAITAELLSKTLFVEGGTHRQASIRFGLEALAAAQPTADIVLIHDGARPFVSSSLINLVCKETALHGAVVPGITVTDSIKRCGPDSCIVEHPERRLLSAVQTPQGFQFAGILDAHRKATYDTHEYTDDSEIWHRYQGRVRICPGERENKKITWQGDL